MTNDVEEVSIVNNNLNYRIAKKVANKGLPRLLDLYSKYDVEGTFYFTGTFAKKFPSAVQKTKDSGHEIGCHGYSHKPIHAFDRLSDKEQYLHLFKAKKIIESIAGKIEAFRAPALRLGDTTPHILDKLGFKTDSSVAPSRFDGPLTSGAIRKLNWLTCPKKPYFLNKFNPYKQGNSSVLEVPVSSFIAGYQGTTMRLSPNLNECIGEYLFRRARRTSNPINFLYHPTEAVTEEFRNNLNRRTKSIISSFFSDSIRRKLKLANLGPKSIALLESVLKKSVDHGFEFTSVRNYRKNATNI